MNYQTEVITDLSAVWDGKSIPAKQGDINSRILQILLLSHGQPYTPPDDVEIRVGMTKPDGQQVLNDALFYDGYVHVVLTEQMLMAAGYAPLEIMLFKDKTMLSSAVIRLTIMQTAYNKSNIESSSEYQSFVAALLNVDSAVKSCEVATEDANFVTATCRSEIGICQESTQNANEAAEAAWKAARGETIVYDPSDGQEKTLQAALNHIWDEVIAICGKPLTAKEYDDLMISAQRYDEKAIFALQYDVNAKGILENI